MSAGCTWMLTNTAAREIRQWQIMVGYVGATTRRRSILAGVCCMIMCLFQARWGWCVSPNCCQNLRGTFLASSSSTVTPPPKKLNVQKKDSSSSLMLIQGFLCCILPSCLWSQHREQGFRYPVWRFFILEGQSVESATWISTVIMSDENNFL